MGEVNSPNEMNACIVCPEGFYSDINEESFCLACPKGFYCPGGQAKEVQVGHWQSQSLPELGIHECPIEGSCLGGNPSQCAEGYQGLLCASCSDGYAMYEDNHCTNCEENYMA